MKKLITIYVVLLALALLFAVQVSAASRVQYDDNDITVAGRVILYRESGDQSDYLIDHNDLGTAKDGYLINTDLSGVDGVDKKYWKVVDGVVIEMTQEDKDYIDVLLTPAVSALDQLIGSADSDDDDAADQAFSGVGTFAALVALFAAGGAGGAGGAALALSKKNAKRIKVLEDK